MMTLTSAVLAVALAQAGWGPPVEWQDDDRLRRAYESPVLVAELHGTEATARRLRELVPDAKLVLEQAVVRLWHVGDAATARALDELTLLPVLHDAKHSRAKPRVAVGGVLVFPKDPTAEAARSLAAQLGGAVHGRAVLVPSNPGRAAWELTAALAKRPDVASAHPNWWLPARGK